MVQDTWPGSNTAYNPGGGGRLPNILPGCVGWGFSNLPIVVHAKNEEDRPIMMLSRQ